MSERQSLHRLARYVLLLIDVLAVIYCNTYLNILLVTNTVNKKLSYVSFLCLSQNGTFADVFLYNKGLLMSFFKLINTIISISLKSPNIMCVFWLFNYIYKYTFEVLIWKLAWLGHNEIFWNAFCKNCYWKKNTFFIMSFMLVHYSSKQIWIALP